MNIVSPLKSALGLALCTVLAAIVHADAELDVSPIDQSVALGNTFSVDVNISGVTDLYGYQFDVLFNPNLIEAVSSSEGSFLPQGGSTFFIPGSNDNLSGIVSSTADTLVGAVPGATGSGSLAVLSFEARQTGVTSISIAGVELIDSAFNFIDSASTSGSVTIGAASPMSAPEIDPASAASALTLLLGGLAMVRGRRAAATGRPL